MLDLTRKRILVTGGNGFLGSHIIKELRNVGVSEIISPSSKACDLRKEENIISLLKDEQPNVVIHCAAAVGGIGANRDNPGSFFYENLIMGTQLMEQSRLSNVEKFVAIGTICCYPKITPVPFKEEELWSGYPDEITGYYGLAKKMLLVQSNAYRKQYGFNSIFLMPVNIYGPGDNFIGEHAHVIPALVKKFVDAKVNKSEEVICWGTGMATREFIYADDCAKAIVMATERYNSSEPVNIGTGQEMPIKNLAEKIAECIGYSGKIVWDRTKPDGQPRRCLDVTRAKEQFGFEATTSFDDGIKRTVDWYINNNI